MYQLKNKPLNEFEGYKKFETKILDELKNTINSGKKESYTVLKKYSKENIGILEEMVSGVTGGKTKQITDNHELIAHYKKPTSIEKEEELEKKDKEKVLHHELFTNTLYGTFQKDHGKEFVELWERNGYRACPYCNMEWANCVAINKGEGKRDRLIPSLDHIESKESDPVRNSIRLANLIPACNTCNSGIKGSQSLQEIFPELFGQRKIHPYDIWQGHFTFQIEGKENLVDTIMEIVHRDGKLRVRFSLSEGISSECGESKEEIGLGENGAMKKFMTDIEKYLQGAPLEQDGGHFSFHIIERLESRQHVLRDIVSELTVHNELFHTHVLDTLGPSALLIQKYYHGKGVEAKANPYAFPYGRLYADIAEQFGKK